MLNDTTSIYLRVHLPLLRFASSFAFTHTFSLKHAHSDFLSKISSLQSNTANRFSLLVLQRVLGMSCTCFV